MLSDKYKTLEQLAPIVLEAKTAGRKVVFTNGCFDILHRGHLELLESARKLGDLMVVAVNTDRSVRQLKGPSRPVMHETDRVALLAALEMVDYVILFDKSDPGDIIEALLPHVLVKGGDWKPEEVIGGDVVEANGGRVVIVPLLPGHSSTRIMERIRQL